MEARPEGSADIDVRPEQRRKALLAIEVTLVAIDMFFSPVQSLKAALFIDVVPSAMTACGAQVSQL